MGLDEGGVLDDVGDGPAGLDHDGHRHGLPVGGDHDRLDESEVSILAPGLQPVFAGGQVRKGEATVLSFVASVDILGKLATLGHSIIKRKAEQDMVKFAQAVKQELEGA